MQEVVSPRIKILIDTFFSCSKICKTIAQVLAILIDKRVTLEEKMIKSYLIQLASTHTKIIEQILFCLEKIDTDFDQNIFDNLSKLTEQILQFLEEFLKAAKYNLNYLEQYFEHDFYAKLKSSNFLEKSIEISNLLKK